MSNERIDTSKYDGHTEGPWESWSDYIMQKGNSWQEPIAEMDFNFKEADAKLMADAPLLLAEVERLREAITDIADEMEQVVRTEYEQEIIEDLRKVIE